MSQEFTFLHQLPSALDAPLVVQADISMSMLRNMPNEARCNALLQGSVQALPLKDDAFDLVAEKR